jgi:hypothetical protein
MKTNLNKLFSWPTEKPTIEPSSHHWFGEGNAQTLKKLITEINPKYILEMGSWTGIGSTNFILNNAQAEDIMNSIDEQAIEMDPEFQIKLAEEIKEGKTPSNLIELVIKIWTDTGLSPRLMVLPLDLIEQAENPPVEVEDIAGGQKEILTVLRMTHQLQEKDPHFFRVGII